MLAQATSVFGGNSLQARAIARLFAFDLVLSVVVLMTVAVLVLWAAWRFRQRSAAIEPRQDEGNAKLETLWTVVPGVVLLTLFVGSARTMQIVNPPVGQRTPNVIVIAHQWWWEYRYPRSGVVTANELHMVAGENWLLEVLAGNR